MIFLDCKRLSKLRIIGVFLKAGRFEYVHRIKTWHKSINVCDCWIRGAIAEEVGPEGKYSVGSYVYSGKVQNPHNFVG